jgi:Acyl-CoA dehydrogenases
MVDFSFTEEQELIREGLHEWCEKKISLEKIREIDEKHEIPREIVKEMAELNFLMMVIPEEHGGTGAEGTLNIQRTIIARELFGKKYIPYRWVSQTLFP